MWITNQGSGRDPAVRGRLLVLTGFGSLAIAAALFSPVRLGVTDGVSMKPTLAPGQPFLFQRPDFDHHPLRRGDVVVFRSGAGFCVKRVLALGGEHFWALGRAGDDLPACRLLAVNVSPAPWRRRYRQLVSREIRVPAGQLFVIGDNAFSHDSRHFGSISAGRIVGRVILPGDDREGSLAGVTWTALPPAPRRS